MSGRQLNRLRQQLAQQEPEPATDPPSSEEEEEEDSGPSNPFALLQDSDESEAEREASSQEEASDDDAAMTSAVGAPPTKLAPALPPPKQPSKRQQAREEEDIDKVLAELGIDQSTTPAHNSTSAPSPDGSQAPTRPTAAPAKPLLAVNMRVLKASDELKRMFGAAAVREDAEDAGAAYAGASRRIRRLAARGLLRTQKLKPGVLIDPGEHWPPFDGGFTMEARGPTASQTFSYVYSAGYQAVQELYKRCQASHDPNAVAALLHTAPYHLDALLTMYDLNRAMGENAAADEMLHRCLYALEMAWHPSFSPATGNSHVDYSEGNLPLFLALSQYAQCLSRRGLHRSALEVSKLLLGLNSEDPTGARFSIDYYALRAGQHRLVLGLAAQGGAGGSMALFPNFAFSSALARRALGAGGEADDALLRAVATFPTAVTALVARAEGRGGRTPAWAQTLGRPFFAQAASDSATLDHLVEVFVERQHLLWKPPAVLEWLHGQCERAATSDAPLPDGLSRGDWAAAREAAYPPCAVSAYRGVLRAADFSDAVARLPPEEVHGLGLGAGNGGLEDLDLADVEAELAGAARAGGGGPAPIPGEELAEGGTLRALLRSFLPWLNAGEQPDYEGAEEEERE
uniref:Transcription factor 25 n=1 Tax=Auxenochlorella protothecoides TaxID=3075 RepID=A0A1D2A2D1_AUXPR